MSDPNNFLSRILENELLRRILRNTGYLFSATGISAALSMVQGIFAARLLGVHDFGVLGTITVFATVVNKLASFRMNEAVVKYIGKNNGNGSNRQASAIFKAALGVEGVTSLLAFVLLLVLAPLGARLFAKDPSTTSWFMVYGGAIILSNLVYESSSGLLQIFDRFRSMALIQVSQSVITLLLIGWAYYAQLGTFEVVLAYMIGKAIGSLGVTVAAFFEARNQWGRGWMHVSLAEVKPQWRELTRFAVSTNISSTLSVINKDGEILWISLFLTPTAAGYYKLAMALANIVQMPVAPLPRATYPELSREVARSDWANVRYILKQGSRIAGAYTVMISVGLALLGRPIIEFIYGVEYLPAYPALLILLVGYLVANTFYWARPALLALELPEYATKVNTLVTSIKIIGLIILLPKIGYLGSPLMVSVSNVLGISLSILRVNRQLNFNVVNNISLVSDKTDA